MRTCWVLRHLPFEDLGFFANVLQAAGYAPRYFDAGQTDFAALDPSAPHLLVVLGGPIGVNDADAYPFLHDELRLLQLRLNAGLPTLGLCLGAQLMAAALGAAVQAGVAHEIGWHPVALTPEGLAGPLRFFDSVSVFHWHSDNLALPDGALRLAHTPACPTQAFALGPNILGLQFHPEVTAEGLEIWYIGHVRAIASDPLLSVAALRAAAATQAIGLQRAGTLFLQAWLGGLQH